MKIKRKTRSKNNKYYQKNERIRYPQLRVVLEQDNEDDNENLGIMPTKKALELAHQKNLDLVVITENTKPPVAKILDFNKFLYEQNKKKAQSAASSKKSKLKEFRVGALIDEGAILQRASRAREFIEDGNQVKFSIQLRGRQKAHPELAEEKVKLFMSEIADIAKPEKEKIERKGSNLYVIMVKK